MKLSYGKRLTLFFVIDLVVLGAALIVFALFHHVIPRGLGDYYGTSQRTDKGDFTSSFPEKFLPKSEMEKGENHYRDEGLSLSLETKCENGVTYHVADIYVKDVTRIQTAFAGGEYATGVAEKVLPMAEKEKAILAVSGDYFGIRQRGVVIRNGLVYRKTTAHDVCVLYYDGTMETYDFSTFDVEKAIAGGAWQAWDFGPELLNEKGEAITEFDTGIAGENPRIAIGYYEPGHYVLVAVDGRQENSRGMTLSELAALFQDLGCKKAYNLDGGHSAVMTFQNEIYSSPSKEGGREISDIIYLAPLE